MALMLEVEEIPARAAADPAEEVGMESKSCKAGLKRSKKVEWDS
tara:strand:- start:605 stop:736 length:132 start_codon:yes stop_codon:yes gene_type:complete